MYVQEVLYIYLSSNKPKARPCSQAIIRFLKGLF